MKGTCLFEFATSFSCYLPGEFASLPRQIRRPSPPPSVGSDHGLLTAPPERFAGGRALSGSTPRRRLPTKKKRYALLFLLVSPRGVEPLIPP